MTVSPITGDFGMFAASNATGATGTANTQADSKMFMDLMVAQMKYQDPMNPADTSTMLTQNATFTQVQAVQEMQKEMGLVLSSQLASSTVAMIGKDVSWVGENGAMKTGTATGTVYTPNGPVLLVGDEQVPIASIAGVGDTSGYDYTASNTGSTTVADGTGPTGYVTQNA
jgi:flagellar basal-body rod modification protein FlgD